MSKLFWDNFSTILSFIVLLVCVGYLIYRRQYEKLRNYAKDLIFYAEGRIVGSKRGRQRMQFVLDQLYSIMPGWLKFFVSRESLKEMLQNWFVLLKDYLDDGEFNKSVELVEKW